MNGEKRIVFQHPDGLCQIWGVAEAGINLPVVLGPFEALGRAVEFASLVKVTPRMAIYKAPLVPGGAVQTFHEAQL